MLLQVYLTPEELSSRGRKQISLMQLDTPLQHPSEQRQRSTLPPVLRNCLASFELAPC